MIQVCSQCGTRWNVRDRQRVWCPRCRGTLLAPKPEADKKKKKKKKDRKKGGKDKKAKSKGGKRKDAKKAGNEGTDNAGRAGDPAGD